MMNLTATDKKSVHTHPRLAAVESVCERMAAGGEDPLVLIAAFIAALRPHSARELAEAADVWRSMLQFLERNRNYREALARTLRDLFASREQRRFYTEAGMLPNTGFYTELSRKAVHKFLPEVPDERDLKDCVQLIFTRRSDQDWIDTIPVTDRTAFWRIVGEVGRDDSEARILIRHQLQDSARIMAIRIAAMGLEPELLRINPRLSAGESPFVALAEEVSRFVGLHRAVPATGDVAEDDRRHLKVLIDQCRDVVRRAHQTAATRGTSIPLTFLLVRLTQHLDRLDLLMDLLTVRSEAPIAELAEKWSEFLRDALEGERQKNSIRKHLSSLLVLLSLRITENASRTGERYITKDRAEWLAMWRAAAGGGFLIAFMALLKLLGTNLPHHIFVQGFFSSLIYAGGFAIIHLLHFTVATKQPAMTAATIAATISQVHGRLRGSERLVALIIDTVRTQVAAIAGNVLIALPLAIAIGSAAGLWDSHLFSADKAQSLLAEIDPLRSASLFYAAIAGIWLFMSGLITGYVDNLTAYSDVGTRIAHLEWLVRMAGADRAERMGKFIYRNAGGLAGNVFFGFALGMTWAFGETFGLPLDIRHIAFSSANLGYALTVLDWEVDFPTLVRSVFGVALIGLVNLAVSFTLALWVALRSRDVEPHHALKLLSPLWRNLMEHPAGFFYPKE
jgi:site-specific recombinase